MNDIHLPHDHGQEPIDIPSPDDFEIVSTILKQLCDAVRIRIFWLLCHREECVLDISAMMQMSSPAVSHHLKQLRQAGLVVSRRSGKEVFYRASDTSEAHFLHEMQWSPPVESDSCRISPQSAMSGREQIMIQ